MPWGVGALGVRRPIPSRERPTTDSKQRDGESGKIITGVGPSEQTGALAPVPRATGSEPGATRVLGPWHRCLGRPVPNRERHGYWGLGKVPWTTGKRGPWHRCLGRTDSKQGPRRCLGGLGNLCHRVGGFGALGDLRHWVLRR